MSGRVIVCVGCGRPVSIYTPICPECLSGIEGVDDDLPPVIGERYRDVLDDIALNNVGDVAPTYNPRGPHAAANPED